MLVIVLGPNPLLRIGQRTIVIGRIRGRPCQWRPFTRASLVYIGRLAPHFITQLTCSFSYEASCNYQLERGRRVAHLLERTICIGLSYLLNIVLAIHDKEVFAGFSSPRGFPRINVVSLVNVYFSVILLLCCSYLLKCKEL